MQLDRSLEGSVTAIDGYPAWRRKRVPSVAGLYPKELVSIQAMREGFLLYGGIS